MNKITIKNMWRHFQTVKTHRKWVRHYCFLAGIYWRGITHDLSKYSPTEFLESVRFYTGVSSPINEAKKSQGYSRAWLHHRGRNSHHWAYWADNFSEGLIVYPMSQNDFIEMVCDFIAAGRTYYGDKFSYIKELHWWMRDRGNGCKAMNQENKIMLDVIFSDFAAVEKLGDKAELTQEQLIKSGYLQKVWKANHNVEKNN